MDTLGTTYWRPRSAPGPSGPPPRGAHSRMCAAGRTANGFAGLPLAGVLAAAGVVAALAAPVTLWAVAVAALVLVRGNYRIPRPRPTTLRADIAEGLRFLVHHKVLR